MYAIHPVKIFIINLLFLILSIININNIHLDEIWILSGIM
jgi:hypothetical protein